MRILLVDDHQDAANSLARCMKVQGHLVQVAYDGATGIKLASQFRPEVVLLDIGLPDMSGIDVCREIRQSLCGDLMAAFAITGWGEDQAKCQEAATVFDMHFLKPVKLDALENAINCLERKRPVEAISQLVTVS